MLTLGLKHNSGSGMFRAKGLRRRRRGATLVEYTFSAGLFFTFIFGGVEFSWISGSRQALLRGVYKGSRTAGLGHPINTIMDDVESGSGISGVEDYVTLEYNSADDGSGTWAPLEDNPASGEPAIANDVPTGKPIRVTISNYPYKMLTGPMFDWMPTVSNGEHPITATMQSRRE